MTVRELKEFLKDMPNTNKYGEDHEVWLETDDGLSCESRYFTKLNSREDGSDLLIGYITRNK